MIKELAYGQGPGDRPLVTISYWQTPSTGELVAASDAVRGIDGVIEVSLAAR